MRRCRAVSAGLSSKFNVLQQSPHDLRPPDEPPPPTAEGMIRWAPSRYTVRASSADGRLILWNTYNGAMVVLRSELRSAVEALLTKGSFAARPRGMVKYLHDRGFLIKEGTDEYRRIQIGFCNQQYRSDV